MDIFGVPEHDFSCNDGQGIDGPGIFPGIDGLDKIPVSGDGIPQPKPGGCKKLGGSPEDDDVIVKGSQGDGGDFLIIIGKFYIGFIHHDKNIILFAHIQDAAHGFPCDGAGGRVVGVAED